MVKRIIQKMLIIAGILVGILVIAAAVIFLLTTFQTQPSTPLVIIHSPEQSQQIGLEELVSVQVTARGEKAPITRLELWENQNDSLRLVSYENSLEPSTSFSVPLGWQPRSIGSHRLLVRAFNDQDEYGQAAVDVEVISTPDDETSAAPADGQVPSPLGGFDPDQPDEFAVNEETLQNEGNPPPPQPEPQPDPNSSGINPGGWFLQNWGDLFIPNLSQTWVEIEALEFEVEQPYNNVVCYAIIGAVPVHNIQHAVRRIPSTGFLEATDEFHWNIADYLSEENRVVVPVNGGQSLWISLQCTGFRNSQPILIGNLEALHPSEDWNGQIYQVDGQQGEGFTVSYRINPIDEALKKPAQLHEITWNQQNYLHWFWDGDPQEIDGFHIYRFNNLIASVPASVYLYRMPQWWTVSPCGSGYHYHVTAYRGGEESPPSNYLFYPGEPCKGEADITQISGMPNCGGTGQRFSIQYNYPGQEPASISARVFEGTEWRDRILSTKTQIQPGSGTAQIALTYHGTQTISTDRIEIAVADENGQEFYKESFDLVIEWQAGKPDLIIEQAWIDRDQHQLHIGLRNQGCACPPAEAPNVSIVREADGWTGFAELEGSLYARSGSVLSVDLNPEEINLWGGLISLSVDPNNDIGEVNEENNSYIIGEARIKAVQVYKIDIHDTKESKLAGKGEFAFWAQTKGVHDEEFYGKQSVFREYHWGLGEHTINNLFLYPVINNQDDLSFRFTMWEWDQGNNQSDDCGEFNRWHDPDPAAEGSWKGGGDFSGTSHTKDFTIYYRIILE